MQVSVKLGYTCVLACLISMVVYAQAPLSSKMAKAMERIIIAFFVATAVCLLIGIWR